jgi:hypothetical protein
MNQMDVNRQINHQKQQILDQALSFSSPNWQQNLNDQLNALDKQALPNNKEVEMLAIEETAGTLDELIQNEVENAVESGETVGTTSLSQAITDAKTLDS